MKKFNVNQNEVESVVGEDMNNSSIYLPKCDSNGVPLLKRIEKYPDLPEDEFIPVEYTFSDGKKISECYAINKLGELKNHSKNNIIKGNINRGYKCVSVIDTIKKLHHVSVHRLVASTFLENPNFSIYSVVNHIDHNPENNNLSNLEWVTERDNMNRESGKCSKVSEEKLVQYVALDNNGNEMFKITRRDDISEIYKPDSIVTAIKRNELYKGYYWKIENKKERIIPGFSGNLDDYEWHEHWKYPGLYVCKEGFIKYNNKLLYSLTLDGYVYSSIQINNERIYFRVHRIIAEFILKRDLRDDEIVDHINTIKTDNSFDNLRVTDAKGNRNNPKTQEKFFKRVVLADLFGNFINYSFAKDIQNIVYKDCLRSKNGMELYNMLKFNILNNKYICIELGNKTMLYKKMENIIYKFSKDKLRVLGAYNSITSAKKESVISIKSISENLNSKKPAPDGNYYLRGPEAVKLVLSLGYGTAGDFKPE
jgi:hypothetical protein